MKISADTARAARHSTVSDDGLSFVARLPENYEPPPDALAVFVRILRRVAAEDRATRRTGRARKAA
ncbi:hypothetical protein ACIGB8_17545 [Promicromonospora sukumoe]|uniref:hypothetical protein n=1 Tax=Promicromonospora sukumoe TaxID=88382 RepID=UPI0037CC51CA